MRTAAVALAFCTWLGSSLLAAPAPVLDGFVNDLFWAEKARTWILQDPAQPDTITRCFLAYDDQYLYFAADVIDTNVIGTNRTIKSKAWEDDAVKLLIHVGDPRATQWTPETFSYTFSATGGITWARGPQPAGASSTLESTWPPSWDSGIKWATGLKPGTNPNVSGTLDAGYAIEARIPWSELGRRPPFKPGDTLAVCVVNICRPEISRPDGKPISSVTAAREITPLDPSVWPRIAMDWQGPLATRGLVEPLPLWMGSPAWEYQLFKSAETDATSRWWDRARWTARLERMRSQNMNTLVLRHTNPWTGLLAPATAATRPADDLQSSMAQIGWFKPEDFNRARDQFRWILAEAKKRGISVYLLFADEPASAAPAPTSQPTTDVADKCQAMSLAARQMLEAYPDLAGIGAGAGFNSPDMLQAIAAGVAAPAAASAPAASVPATSPAGRDMLVWTDGAQIDSLVQLARSSPRIRLIHSLQGAQWYKPLSDARIQQLTARVDELRARPGTPPVSSIAVANLRGASSYMFWADPQWARTLTLDLRNQGIQGFLLDAGPGRNQLGREALFEYAYNAGQQFSPQRWHSRLQVYGAGEYSGQLFEAMQHASAIMPEALQLIDDPSGCYMPQFGLLLAHYLELPTCSTRPGDVDPGDMRTKLLGSLGPAWPNPIWGRTIAGIRAEVDRTAAPDAVPASDIVSRLASHVDACKSLLPSLRNLKPNAPEQAAALNQLLDAIELNVQIGDHMVNKIRAAIAFAQYQQRRGRAIDCIQPLQKSLEAWAKVVEISDRLYPETLEYWQSQPVSPPPWSADVLSESYVPVVGRWRDQARRFDRELNLIREALAGGVPRVLPLWDHVNAYPEEKRQTRFVIDFEQPDSRYRIGNGAAVEQDPKNVLAGKRSLLVDTRNLPAGRQEVFVTDPGLVPLMSAQKYQISLLYRVLDPGKGQPAFEIGVRPSTGGQPIGDHRTWTAPAGLVGSRILQVPPPAQDGNVFYIATTSPAAVVIDAVSIAQINE